MSSAEMSEQTVIVNDTVVETETEEASKKPRGRSRKPPPPPKEPKQGPQSLYLTDRKAYHRLSYAAKVRRIIRCWMRCWLPSQPPSPPIPCWTAQWNGRSPAARISRMLNSKAQPARVPRACLSHCSLPPPAHRWPDRPPGEIPCPVPLVRMRACS